MNRRKFVSGLTTLLFFFKAFGEESLLPEKISSEDLKVEGLPLMNTVEALPTLNMEALAPTFWGPMASMPLCADVYTPSLNAVSGSRSEP